MKKLKLQRETVRLLNHVNLGNIHGGAIVPITIKNTEACPIHTLAGCTGGPCVETTTTVTSGTDTSISILPSG